MKHSSILLAAAFVLCSPLVLRAQFVPPFYNYGGIVAYQPVVDTILSGTSLTLRPTVSHDRKYVTLGMSASLSHLVELHNFPVVVGAGGLVGGALPAAPVAGTPAVDVNASLPVRIQTGRGGEVLRRPGMTRIE